MATTLKTVGEYEGLSGSQISLSKLAQVCPSPPANPGRLSSWAGHEHTTSFSIDFYLQTSSPPVNIEEISIVICNTFISDVQGSSIQLTESNDPVYIGNVIVNSTNIENYPYVGIGNGGIFTSLGPDSVLTLSEFKFKSDSTGWIDIISSPQQMNPYTTVDENMFYFRTTLIDYINNNNPDRIDLLMSFVP